MPVRLNITMDEDLYRRLKKELPPKGISSFINKLVEDPAKGTITVVVNWAARIPR